jgi:hypothetical protein
VIPVRRAAIALVVIALAGGLSACSSGPDVAQSAPGLNCVNYALQGSGQYHNEVAVKVSVTNPTTQTASYTVRVGLTASSDPSDSVTLTGSVASHRSAVLARRVLTTDRVQACRVDRIVRLGQP